SLRRAQRRRAHLRLRDRRRARSDSHAEAPRAHESSLERVSRSNRAFLRGAPSAVLPGRRRRAVRRARVARVPSRRLFALMFLAGLPLSTLLGIGAAAGALVVVFYILKLRRRPVAVPFSKIWQRILRDKEATSLFSQLKRLLSLLLQLALLALMLFALGDPRTMANLVEGRNIVILVDSSASMKATDVAPSRIDAAKEKVRSMVRGLSGSDRMLIAQMDAAATPLSTLTGEVAELEAGVAKIAPTDASADFARGLRFAADTLR